MRRLRVHPLLLAFGLFCVGVPTLAGAAPLQTLQEVEDCIAANRPEKSVQQSYEMKSTDRIGSTRTSEGNIYWKMFDDGLSKVLVEVTGPLDVRGTSALIMEREEGSPDIFSYLPALEKVRRVTERTVTGSFMGSDFSYEDIERLQGMGEDAERSLQPPSEIDGRPVYVIHAVPGRGGDSEYSRIETYVDQEMCVALRVLSFDPKNKLAKTFTAPRDQVQRVGGRWIPHALDAVSEQDQTHTTLRIRKVEIDGDIPRRYFSMTSLQRRGR